MHAGAGGGGRARVCPYGFHALGTTYAYYGFRRARFFGGGGGGVQDCREGQAGTNRELKRILRCIALPLVPSSRHMYCPNALKRCPYRAFHLQQAGTAFWFDSTICRGGGGASVDPIFELRNSVTQDQRYSIDAVQAGRSLKDNLPIFCRTVSIILSTASSRTSYAAGLSSGIRDPACRIDAGWEMEICFYQQNPAAPPHLQIATPLLPWRQLSVRQWPCPIRTKSAHVVHLARLSLMAKLACQVHMEMFCRGYRSVWPVWVFAVRHLSEECQVTFDATTTSGRGSLAK